MDEEFLTQANKIRKRLSNDFDELELLVKKRTSKYNKELYVTKCVICGVVADDVHHISHQAASNKAGFIGHFHQDHRSNLVPLCKQHHREIHEGKIKVKGFVMTSNGLELDFEEQIVEEVKVVVEPEINIIEDEGEEKSSLGWDDF